MVTVDGFSHKSRDNLHGYWDTQFVDALGRPPAAQCGYSTATARRVEGAKCGQGP
jgi:hypothetical protein